MWIGTASVALHLMFQFDVTLNGRAFAVKRGLIEHKGCLRSSMGGVFDRIFKVTHAPANLRIDAAGGAVRNHTAKIMERVEVLEGIRNDGSRLFGSASAYGFENTHEG